MKAVLFCLGLLVGGYFLLLAIAALLVDQKRSYSDYNPFYRFLMLSVCDIALFFCKVRVKCKGKEKLPEEPFLLVCNHRSSLDPLSTLVALRSVKLTYISKPENLKLPIFGQIGRRCCCLPIDRENPRKAMETIKSAAELLKKAEYSVVVYPEGTRNRTDTLLPFHNGVLKIAQMAAVPVVVATIEGTEKVNAKNIFSMNYVTLNILSTLSVEEITKTRSVELGEKIRNMMEVQLKH